MLYIDRIAKQLVVLAENTIKEFNQDGKDRIYAFFYTVSSKGNFIYPLILSDNRWLEISQSFLASEKIELNAKTIKIAKQSLRWAVGEDWFIPKSDLLENANSLILKAIENNEIELFDGVVEELCIKALKELHEHNFFGDSSQSIVVGLTHRSESDEEFINWIKQTNSSEILEKIKRELNLMYAAQKIISSGSF